METKGIETKDLVLDLSSRQGVKSMQINENEFYRVRAAGEDGSKERYIRVDGPAIILFIEDNKNA